jgi:hypothetical protein
VVGTNRAGLRRAPLVVLAVAALVVAGCGASSNPAASSSAAKTSATTPKASGGPERVALESGPTLAPPTTAPGFPVDGIKCAPVEQLAYHIHAHLQVYVNGQSRSLPAGIGLLEPVGYATPRGPVYGASKCYYWLHTHASDGIIHVESPTVRIYTLGDFFDEWGQPLSRTQVATVRGAVTAFVNGHPWTKDPRGIPLLPHGVIQLDVGSPAVAFVPMSWAGLKL